MAIPKKGTRKIFIEEEAFIWLIRRQATNGQADYPEGCLHVAVEHGQEVGSALVIITDRLHPEGFSLVHGEFVPIQPQNEYGKIEAWRIERRYTINPVMPSDIELWIQQALQMGWMPRKLGKPFVVQVIGQGLERI